jgi:hypothetical protein
MAFNVTGNETFHKNITDLYPWTTYMFCIAAQTTSGKGAEICKEQQTLQDWKENLSFSNKYMIYELSISIKQIYIMNHVNVEALTTGRMIKWRLIVQKQSYRHCDKLRFSFLGYM